jgi:arylsulfatase A-like enzyme/Tfp pilus assembly protein PilF
VDVTARHALERFARWVTRVAVHGASSALLRASFAVLLVYCPAISVAASQKATAHHPNIVLITLDTTRADRMGFLGSRRGLTPNLDELARRAAVFSNAYAQVPLTTPSHATILSGTFPQFHRVNYMGDPLSKPVPFLPDLLHAHGYRTAAFVGSLVLEPKKLAMGFERGFDHYDAGYHRRIPPEDRYHSMERRAEDVISRAVNWMSKRPAGPFFLWVHLYDPHDPYSPPEPFRSRYQAEPYDGEIAYTDAALAKLFSALRAQKLFDSTVIAVMADHGEAFGEHGEKHHGIFLYDETIHVPLLIKPPNSTEGVSVSAKVGLVDVAPTILEIAQLPVPRSMQGNSLLSMMNPARAGEGDHVVAPERPVYSESGYGELSFGWSKLQAWRTSKYLYVEAPDRELYDLSTDPQAKHNLAATAKAVTETSAAKLKDFYSKTEGNARPSAQLDVDQSESLHALGYLTSSKSAIPDREKSSKVDPKQKIATANLLYEALVAMEQDNFAEAVPRLEEVLQQEPNTPIALLQLGRAYMSLKEYQKAVAPLQSLVEKKPDDAFGRYELGCALVKTGQWDAALPHFEAAVSQLTSSSMMHFYLALVYQRTSRISEAAKEFQSAVRLDPDNFAANLLLGRILLMQQKAPDALPYLRKANRLRADSIDVHRFLSDVYTQLGQSTNARRELAEAERLQLQGASRLGTPREETSHRQRP